MGLAFSSFFFLFFSLIVGFRRPLSDDESIFLYGAQQLSRGDYGLSQFWDHKGPFLYWLNFFSLNIPLPNFLGVSVVQGFLTGVSLYFLATKLSEIGLPIKLIQTVLWSFNVTLVVVILNLNTTEGWSVPFQIITYSILLHRLIYKSNISNKLKLEFIWVSVLAFCFIFVALIRVNNSLGILLASFIYISTLKSYRIKLAAVWATIVVAISSATILFYYLNGNLRGLVSQYLSYNADYSNGMSFSRRLFGLNYFVFNYIRIPIFVFLIVLLILAFTRIKLATYPILVLISLAAVDFISQTLSGRGNRQYIPATIVSLLVLFSYLIIQIFRASNAESIYIALAIFVAYSVTVLSLENFETSWHAGYKMQISQSQYLLELTALNETIYYYGPSPQSLVRTETQSISKYIYLAPALSSFSRNQRGIASELTKEVIDNKPRYILRDLNSCSFELKECYEGNEQYLSENDALGELRSWILQQYSLQTISNNLEVWVKN